MTAPQRVLVVDEDQYFRDTIRDSLVADDLPCEVAAGGAEVQKVLDDPRVACVLLDVRVRRPDALELIELLRKERPALRVIAMSGHEEQDRVLEALRRGAADYLAKPIHDEELCLAVRRALETHAALSRWESTRERLQRLAAHAGEIERIARESADPGELAGRVVSALAEALGAKRTSLLRLSDDGERLRVEAFEGQAPAPDGGDAAVAESVAGLALSEGHALRIDDIETDPRCAGRVRRGKYRSSSLVLAPLGVGEDVFGVLCATDRAGGGAFGDEDLALITLLARQASSCLEPPGSAGVEAPGDDPPEPAAPQRDPSEPATPSADATHLELLRDIADAMTRETVPERLLAASLRPIARVAGARAAAVFLIDNRSGRLVREAHWEGDAVERSDLPRDAGLTGGSLQSGTIVATERPERDPRFDPEVDTPGSGGAGPLLVIPLRVKERVLGVARVFCGAEEGASARLGELLAAPLSAATRNVLLYRSLLESVEDVARARRESGGRYGP